MTPQEQQLIAGLIDRVTRTQLTEKDPEAEQMLQQGLGRTSDALYILAQTVLVQQFALEQAKRQLADAQAHAQAQEPKHATSFLGSLFGHTDPAPPPPPPPPQQAGYQPVPNYQPAPAQGSWAPQAQPQMMGAPAGGGFLRSALQTATGVAAGALAFQGVESLLHGFGGGGGFGGGQGFGGFGDGGGRPEEIVNNYYGDSGPNSDSSLSPDIEDRRNDSRSDNAQFADTGDDSAFGDTAGDSGDSGDLGAFDDGGSADSFDNGGGDDSSFS